MDSKDFNKLSRLIENAEQLVGKDATAIWKAVEPMLSPEDSKTYIVMRMAIESYTGQTIQR